MHYNYLSDEVNAVLQADLYYGVYFGQILQM